MLQDTVFLSDYNLKSRKTDGAGEIIFRSFFPGKFSPPRIDPNFHLYRKSTIEKLIGSRHQVIFIEARAGQGKSVVAAQFLQRIKANYAWLQLDLADRDPIVTITAIFAALMRAFPGLNKSVLYDMILNNELIEQESDRLAPALINDLNPFLKEDFYLVVDDLHLLKTSEKSLNIIESIISKAPAKLRFIFMSRNSSFAGAISKKKVLHLDNASLALSQSDIAELFAKIFKTPLPAKIVAELHQITEGWIMGLILASHALSNNFNFRQPGRLKKLVASQPGRFWDYFHSELMLSLSYADRRNLLSLALLDDIPLGLAECLSLTSDVFNFLEYLVRRNFFLRRLENTPPSYCFHHLFQEFLRGQALKELSVKEQRIIWAKSGRWHLQQHRFEQALHYYLKAQSYTMVERILQRFGLQLKAANRPAISIETLKGIPPEIVKKRAWLCLTAAAVYSTIDPVQSKGYLDTALQNFILQENESGEILTLAALITYHVGVDCNFRAGKALMPRIESLYAVIGEKISVAARIHIASAVAYGLCYFEGQFERAALYTKKIIQTAQKRGLYDAMAMGVIARGLICNFDGNWNGFETLIEESFFLLQSARVNNINKLSIIALQINALAYQGDLVICNFYRKLIELWVDPELLSKTFFGAVLIFLDANIAVAEGRIEEAKIYLQKGLEAGGINLSTHMQSIYWGRYAYIYAMQKDSEKALEALEKSSQLRNEVGGAFFDISNKITFGSIHTLLENFDTAERFLSGALSEIESIGKSPVIISVFAYRAFARIKNGKKSDGLEDLKKFLSLFKQFRYPYFQNFNSTVLKELLTIARLQNIEPEDTQWIGKKFLRTTILENGEHIPLLEITTLGRLEFKIEGIAKISFGDFTRNQRELLALLISDRSNKGIPYTAIQEAFWPNSSEDKMRSKLDNLFSRLRKVFNTLLAPYSANHYLSMEKGYVHLKNCNIDADIFKENVKQGKRHLKRNEFWQAGNAFLRAYFLYAGEFMPGVYLNDPAAYYREDLQHHFVDCSIHWAGLLSASGSVTEAIQVCQRAILCDPGNETLVRLLYRLFSQSNNPVQAKKIIINYRRVLKEDGFSTEEIEEVISNF